MPYYMAPLEGVTTYLYRQLHHRYFPGVDKYFTPFISTHQEPLFTKKDMLEFAPAQNEGIQVVPQLMSKSAGDFNWAVQALADMGYTEVNLNLGCPSGTVVAKGKGSGFLGHLDRLEPFFDEVFAKAPIAISVKTRLGLKDEAEFQAILALYNRYPIHELSIHPRVRMDYYKNPVHMDVFAQAVTQSKNPVCYNGDIATKAQAQAIEALFPNLSGVMIGRGLIGNPAMLTQEGAQRERLQAFVTDLYEGYAQAFGDRRNATLRMKEVWFYLVCLFDDHEKLSKELKKAKEYTEYEDIVRRIFQTLPLRQEAEPGWVR